MNGDLEQAGDRWRLRFARDLAYPPEKVWRAVTEPAHLDAWFPQRILGEWAAGAPLTFESRSGEFPPFDGEVLACEPPSLLEFRWGSDVIRFEIVPNPRGCTFVLTDTFDETGQGRPRRSRVARLPRFPRRTTCRGRLPRGRRASTGARCTPATSRSSARTRPRWGRPNRTRSARAAGAS